MKFHITVSLLFFATSILGAQPPTTDGSNFKLIAVPFKAPSIKTVQGENMQLSYIESETGYSKTNSEVFFINKKIDNADAESFRYFDKSNFALDKLRVFAHDKPLTGADVSSFKPLGMSYAKDKLQVYYWHNIIQKADPNTFKIIEARDAYSADKTHIFKGHVRLENIDPHSFQLLSGNLVKDNKGVYYVSGSESPKMQLIKNVDAPSLTWIKYGYFKDKNKVYHLKGMGAADLVPVVDADVKTFEVFDKGWGWAKDKSNVYNKEGQKMAGVSPVGFIPPK